MKRICISEILLARGNVRERLPFYEEYNRDCLKTDDYFNNTYMFI